MDQMPDTHSISSNIVADWMNQLSDPIRLRIMRILCKEELAVGELIRVVQIPQSSGSRHLKTLSEGGWLVRRSVGPATYYRVVLDELPMAMRGVWIAIRDGLNDDAAVNGDDQRLLAILHERITDSESFFGRIAGEWDGVRNDLFGNHFTDQALLGLINPTWRVADLGCGTGNCTELLAAWVNKVIAIDRSNEMLEGARARLERVGARVDHVDFVEGDLTKIPLSGGSVDAAVCMLVAHHLPNPIEALKEMRRILTDEQGGGVVLIVDMCSHRNEEYRRAMGHVHLGFNEDEITEMLHEAGFERVLVNTLRPDVNGSGPPLFAAVAWMK